MDIQRYHTFQSVILSREVKVWSLWMSKEKDKAVKIKHSWDSKIHTMSCNTSSFALPFKSSTKTWLYEVIDIGDIDFGFNDTSEAIDTGADIYDEKFQRWNLNSSHIINIVITIHRSLVKVGAVILLVTIALTGNFLVIHEEWQVVWNMLAG